LRSWLHPLPRRAIGPARGLPSPQPTKEWIPAQPGPWFPVRRS
jgi:hypothetical protein